MKTSAQNAIAIAGAALFLAAIVQKSSAATTTVLVGSGGDIFTPANVSISPNDSVIWDWQGFGHSTTSGTNGAAGDDNGVPSGLWDSGIKSVTNFFTNTFTSTGVYSYYCTVHYRFGMLGQVLVSIAITNPANGSLFAAPANVAIQAGAADAVTNVQFLVNNTQLASENSGPFSTVANNLTAGAYTLSAIARDTNGLSATNSVGISVITPKTVLLSNSSMPTNNNFQFSYSTDIGLNYVVQRSTDLITWNPLITNTAASNPVVFDDSNATNSFNFYRVGRLPNP